MRTVTRFMIDETPIIELPMGVSFEVERETVRVVNDLAWQPTILHTVHLREVQ